MNDKEMPPGGGRIRLYSRLAFVSKTLRRIIFVA
jgi:hypothetical protein